VGIFFSDSGGGGERVLWQAVQAIQENHAGKDVKIIIYSGDRHAQPKDIIARAEDRFHVRVTDEIPVEFVFARTRWMVEAKYYPRFTMIGQSFGSICLALECLLKYPCHVFCDTTGFAFTYPIAKVFFGAKVVCYTHYPTISTDMLNLVQDRKGTYNNDSSISASFLKSRVKLIYYRVFARAYGWVGGFSDKVMANSSWTFAHLIEIWGASRNIKIVFPPCDTEYFQTFALENRKPWMISIGQFRPEKDHRLQLKALSVYNESAFGKENHMRLFLVGGARNKEDLDRVEALKSYALELKIADSVEFHVNASRQLLDSMYKQSLIGIHTMWNEHFGIGVVELMAAGVITIAHNSGGPKTDIVIDGTGYLAESPEEYASKMTEIMSAYRSDPNCPLRSLRSKARTHSSQFSDQLFRSSFFSVVESLLK
jgi:alpha-1,2-mannosyltransferase